MTPRTPAPARPSTTATRRSAAHAGDTGAKWRRRIAYLFLIGYAVLLFVPFTWSVVTSFKTLPDSVHLTLIPQPFTTAGWEFAFHAARRRRIQVLFFNSLIIATAVTITNLVLGSMAGYAFARLRFPGREVLFLIVLATLMIPDQLRLVPVYLLFNGLGLTRGVGQYIGVITVMAISATSIFLLRQYFLSIPRDLEEAAKIDGAGFFTTFVRVMLPLAGPALAAVAILQFQGTWNSFFWPLLLLGDQAALHAAAGAQLLPARRRLFEELAAADGHGRHGDDPGPRAVRVLPALLRRRDRGQWRQGLTRSALWCRSRSRSLARPSIPGSLRASVVDFFYNSWRLVPANLVWGVAFVAIALTGLFAPLLGVLLVPLLAVPTVGLFRIAALIVRGGSVSLGDGFAAFRTYLWPSLAAGVAMTVAVLVGTWDFAAGITSDSAVGLGDGDARRVGAPRRRGAVRWRSGRCSSTRCAPIGPSASASASPGSSWSPTRSGSSASWSCSPSSRSRASWPSPRWSRSASPTGRWSHATGSCPPPTGWRRGWRCAIRSLSRRRGRRSGSDRPCRWHQTRSRRTRTRPGGRPGPRPAAGR